MKNKVTLFILFLFIGNKTLSSQVNYSEHIAPIIYENCTSCHRAGEIGPISFTNYEEVSAWSSMIQYVTETSYMPPWKPNLTYSHFVGERGLTNEEIQLISEWTTAGSPPGDPSLEPPLPNFPTGSQLGSPDLVLEMTEAYQIEGNNQDDYRVFVLPTGLIEDKEIAAVEFRAGNRRAVHHALIAFDTDGEAAEMDAQTPEYGYPAFGDFGVQTEGRFTGYTPGIQTVKYPDGIGKVLPAGADLLIQVHYAPMPADESDQSKVNIFFKEQDDPIARPVKSFAISPINLDNGWFSFFIPPNEVKTFHGEIAISGDKSFISVYPHCHYLGKEWEIFAVAPGNDTIPIIKIDDWDFNWQGAYTFDRMKKIPDDSKIHINATYDNTQNNPYNPSNPPQSSAWGEGTTDEMYLVGISYVPYQEGDEDILIGEDMTTIIDEINIGTKNKFYPPFPNPANGAVMLNYYLHEKMELNLTLFDLNGRLIKTIFRHNLQSSGNHTIEFNTADINPGNYMVRLMAEGVLLSRPLVIFE